MKIKSMAELSDADKKKIQDILTESNCINESLKNTFGDRYNRMDRDTIFFGPHSHDFVYEIYPRMGQTR